MLDGREAVVQGNFRPAHRAPTFRVLEHRVRDGNHLDAADSREVAQVGLAHTTQAEKSNSDRVFSAHKKCSRTLAL